MNKQKGNKAFDKMSIGQILLVEKWLEKYCIPFKKDDIKRETDENEKTISFKVKVDKDAMLKDYENENLMPEFVKSGEVVITFTLRA